MDYVRSRMREENLPALKRRVKNLHIEKSELNVTKAINQEAEDLIVEALRHKFAKRAHQFARLPAHLPLLAGRCEDSDCRATEDDAAHGHPHDHERLWGCGHG